MQALTAALKSQIPAEKIKQAIKVAVSPGREQVLAIPGPERKPFFR
jgi:transcriptional/translational regulatory protein YebC/TACO1